MKEQEFTIQEIEKVHAGWKHPVRTIQDPKVCSGLIIRYVLEVARDFGGRKEVSADIQKACVRIVKNHFKKLAPHEIYQAFEWKAAGLIKVENAEFYYGELNAEILGKVLTAYVERRTKLVNAFIEEEHRIKQEKEAAEKKAQKQKEYEHTVSNFEILYKEANYQDWRDIPEYFYDIAMKKGLIQFEKGEGKAIFEEAKAIANVDLKKEYISLSYDLSEDKEKVAIAKSTLMHQINSGAKDGVAKAYARKITMFRKLKDL